MVLVDVFECFSHVQNDLRHVVEQHGIVTRVKLFQVRALHVFHHAIMRAVGLAVFEIADDALVTLTFFQCLAAVGEAFLGSGVTA